MDHVLTNGRRLRLLIAVVALTLALFSASAARPGDAQALTRNYCAGTSGTGAGPTTFYWCSAYRIYQYTAAGACPTHGGVYVYIEYLDYKFYASARNTTFSSSRVVTRC